jgi:RNA polymerase sigma factor (sigma-70 family)
MRIGSRGSVLRWIETLFGAGSVTGMTDGQLLEQFLARHNESAETAFSALVSRHGPMVWNVCLNILSESHAAEDAFQATFLILVKKAGSIRRRETLAPWLHGVARRVAVRARKNAARSGTSWGEMSDMKANSAPDPSRQEELDALHQEVDRLPERYRAVLVLCHLEGRTHAEAARLLNCPAATVSIRVSRARERLRARLTRRGFALSAFAGLALGSESAWAAPPASLAESTIKSALCLAAGKSMTAGMVPAAAMNLTDGVLRTMHIHKLAITATSLLVALVTSGIGLFAMSGLAQKQPQAAQEAALSEKDEAKARNQTADNLRRLALAMYNFATTNPTLAFPAAAISKDGKPLLSWRVALLPYLDTAVGRDQHVLYEKFHLDEPWNSPHNKALLDQMPEVFAPVVRKGDPKGSTYYQVFSGPGALFEGTGGKKIEDVFDGTSNTFLVVEAAKAVPWTKPEDLPFDKDQGKVNPLPRLGGQFDGGFHAVFADGAAYLISKTIDVATLRALITRNGGEVIPFDKIPSTPPREREPQPDVKSRTPTASSSAGPPK